MPQIAMLGIDFTGASLAQRERFSCTASSAAALADAILRLGAQGCVVLSTCNRTEVWCSGAADLPGAFCRAMDCDKTVLQGSFVFRQGAAAVQYLFELACGIHSQIFGEDQILTQLEDALVRARENGQTDSVLETLFRSARTAAKRVKTEIPLARKDRSVPERALSMLEERYGSLAEKQCLVIGNGQMGRLLCSLLVERGAQVTLTVRKYHHQETVVPYGCQTIAYAERNSVFPQMDYVFSATVSPHYTVRCEHLTALQKPMVLVDLAVPRDIEPLTGTLEHVQLWNMDDLGAVPKAEEALLLQAQGILQEGQQEFFNWMQRRDHAVLVREIGLAAGEQTGKKLEHAFRQGKADRQQIECAVAKSVEKLLYDLQAVLPPEAWSQCIEALYQVSESED